MKNLAKVLTLILAVSFIATGCNLLNKEESVSTETQVVNADTVLDQQIYQRALGSKDAKACSTIKDEVVKTECSDTVEALVLIEKAVAKIDDDFCGDIKLERYEDECEASIAAILDQQKAVEKQAALTAKQEEDRLAIEEEAIKKEDYTICNKITDGNQKASCKFNVITGLVVSSKNSEECENIGNINLIRECQQTIESQIL